MDCRGGVNAIFKRAALLALSAVMCVAFGSSAVVAGPLKNLERGIIVDIGGADAVLYEVTENMYLVDSEGRPVGPEQAVARKPKPRWPAGPESERRCARTSRWRSAWSGPLAP
jgi:hypothetical protein